jgi:hypothetical protein
MTEDKMEGENQITISGNYHNTMSMTASMTAE